MNACPWIFPANSNKFKPFLKQNLDMDVSIKGSYLIITLTPAKTTKSTTATTDIPLIRLG
jgi:hypothetical protein